MAWPSPLVRSVAPERSLDLTVPDPASRKRLVPPNHGWMMAARGQLPGLIVVTPAAPHVDATGPAGRAATLIDAAAVDHTVHVVVADAEPRESANQGGLTAVPGAYTLARIGLSAQGPDGTTIRRPTRAVVHDITDQLGAVDARTIEGVLVLGLQLTPVAASLAEWLGVPLLVDAASDHQGLLRPERPSVGAEPDWYLGAGCAARAACIITGSEHEAELVERHIDIGGRTAIVPDVASVVAWQVAAPTRTGQVLVRGDFTQPADLAAARWLVVEVLPLLPEPLTLELVGPDGPEIHHVVNRRPGVRVLGEPAQVLDAYHFADVAVAAHRLPGAGRTPVLEAFSHRRAVVATSAAVDGLQVTAGEHLRIADAPDTFAGSLMALARPRTPQAEQMVEQQVAAAAELAGTTYHPDVVRALGAEALSTATGVRPRSAA
jgi:hypothetical protein